VQSEIYPKNTESQAVFEKYPLFLPPIDDIRELGQGAGSPF